MPTKAKIINIMTEEVLAVDYNGKIRQAERLMKEHQIRHVPVVSEKKYVGMITERKIIEYKLKQLYDYEVQDIESEDLLVSDYKNIMRKDIPLIYPEDGLAKATELMLKNKVDVLPVIDWDKNLVGIVTSIDLLLYFHKKLKEDY